ncbi:MAG: DUF2341 domain-containing protein [Nitrososphaeria archaeon]|nr:DUF2341 domain-containing protein [Nitrososphaeria archaeon]
MALNPSKGWQKYAELSINNASVDYQMRLEIRRGSSQNNDPQQGIIYDDNNCFYDDFRDVRIGTSADPTIAEQLPMWAEEVSDGVKRIIWVKTNGNTTLYIFIGNENAGEYSNGNDTFPYFDHWTSDNTVDWIHTNTGNNHHHWWENTHEFTSMKEIDMRGYILNWWTGPWDHTELGWTVDKTSFVHNVEHVLIYFEHRTTNGAVSDKISVKLHIRKGDTTTTTDLKFFNKPSTDTPLYLQLWHKSNEVKYIIRDLSSGTILAEDSISDPNVIPNPANTKYLVTQQWDCAGGLFQWLSPHYLKWGSKQYNGGMEWKTDYWFERKRAYTEPSWNSFSAWKDVISQQIINLSDAGISVEELLTEKTILIDELAGSIDEILTGKQISIEEIASAIEKLKEDKSILILETVEGIDTIFLPGIGNKLSDISITPARVVTTHFPAVAGLPLDKKIRIYAKAVSGQEKEVVLEALTW